MEPNEAPEAALIRELQEELGIDTEASCWPPDLRQPRLPGLPLLMPLFACRRWKGTPVAREGQVLKWVRARGPAGLPDAAGGCAPDPILRDWLG